VWLVPRAELGLSGVRSRGRQPSAGVLVALVAVSPFFENAIQNEFCGTRKVRRNPPAAPAAMTRCRRVYEGEKKKRATSAAAARPLKPALTLLYF
jgi:hypothetical protein